MATNGYQDQQAKQTSKPRRTWSSPKVQRISMKDALHGFSGIADGPLCFS